MSRYLLKRIFIFIPTLLVIILLAFIISVKAPGDPLDRMVTAQDGVTDQSSLSWNAQLEKDRWRTKLGLDLPVFYFSITNAATPDTLYRIYDKRLRETSKRLIQAYGNWEEISAYQISIQELAKQVELTEEELKKYTDTATTLLYRDTVNETFFQVQALKYAYSDATIRPLLQRIRSLSGQHPVMHPIYLAIEQTQSNWTDVVENSQTIKRYIPTIHFYRNNQFHRWVFGDGNWLTAKGAVNTKGIIRGDFGYSYQTKLPVHQVIGDRMRWSLFFSLISVCLAYIISIPLGIRAAAKRNSVFDRTSSVILFVLYSMPTFWVATLLLMGFANPLTIQAFPASGVEPMTGIPEGTSWLQTIAIRIPYLILPTISYTYAQLAFLSRITRVSMLETLSQDYVRTAQAKGLSQFRVIYVHAFRNALLPLITVFSNIFPAAIGGSVILETIFGIPGMGQHIFQAIYSNDYPVIITVFTLTGVLTLVGYLIADILYAIADPRITFSKK